MLRGEAITRHVEVHPFKSRVFQNRRIPKGRLDNSLLRNVQESLLGAPVIENPAFADLPQHAFKRAIHCGWCTEGMHVWTFEGPEYTSDVSTAPDVSC